MIEVGRVDEVPLRLIEVPFLPRNPAQDECLLRVAVAGMRAGSVVVDLAAAKGGNCACTEADQVIRAHGVTIIGHTNLPAQVPNHASQMYARNLTTFLAHLVQEGELRIDLEDEITAGSLLAHDGAVANERVRQLLGAAAPETES